MSTIVRKLNIQNTSVFAEHRSGWQYCMRYLHLLQHQDGVIFDDFIDRTFGWDRELSQQAKRIPYTRPWIGMWHNPPNMPEWYDRENSPQAILAHPTMQASLKHCLGVFTLSDYLRDWLVTQIPVPVESLKLDSEAAHSGFSLQNFIANPNKKLIQAGVWLRRFERFTRLHCPNFQKTWLLTTSKSVPRLNQEYRQLGQDPAAPRFSDVRQIGWVNHQDFDALLSNNIVFTDLFDASANNLVVECIVRNTPVLVNPLSAVIEYLGPDYPLYFDSIDQAECKLQDLELISAAHHYLCKLDKRPYLENSMHMQIADSKIYRELPVPITEYQSLKEQSTKDPKSAPPRTDNMMRSVRSFIDQHMLRDPSAATLSADAEFALYEDIVASILRDNMGRWDS